MTPQLTRENLHGIWAAIATPFDDHARFDEDVFRENLRRLHAAGVHGIYTTDSDGEFYAIELEEFRRIVDVFADEAGRLGVLTQVGVTWTNTQGMLDRLRHAADRGILGAHVGHPYFMPMTPDSYRAFWDDIQAAVPDWFALIHYNTPRVHNYQRGPDYAALKERVPGLVGTKHVGSDVREFMALMADAGELSHFAGEGTFTPFAFLGARGVYSWFANFNPRYMVEWHAEVERRDWERAMHRQRRMNAFMRATAILQEDGNLHGIVGKAVTAASAFLIPSNRTRRPYLPVSDELIGQFRASVEEHFPDMLWRGLSESGLRRAPPF
jgi:4-hydroxy-tetrahydrodipicolinate synthase